jgi:hypothetical protein
MLTATYRVLYRMPDSVRDEGITVQVIDGYSTFGDIPTMIAVRNWGRNDPEAVASVTIIALGIVSAG